MSGKRIRGGKPPMAQKRHRAESEPREQDTVHKKTAIELAMEEADEYERQKETEQRRLQQLKLLSTHRTLNLQHFSVSQRVFVSQVLVDSSLNRHSQLRYCDEPPLHAPEAYNV
mmetsp:Transcript_765/g.2514  ORF Transcript_765/g.2514 Transcript_765/m.2514 type:complete len:114 (+) Transcript_765:2-343(+)